MTKRYQQYRTLCLRLQETAISAGLGLALVKDHTSRKVRLLNALLKRDPENALANLGEADLAAQGKRGTRQVCITGN